MSFCKNHFKLTLVSITHQIAQMLCSKITYSRNYNLDQWVFITEPCHRKTVLTLPKNKEMSYWKKTNKHSKNKETQENRTTKIPITKF